MHDDHPTECTIIIGRNDEGKFWEFWEIHGNYRAPCPKNQKNLKKTLLSLIFGYCHYDILLNVPGKNKKILRARLRDIL